MASGYLKAGVDLDTLFAARSSAKRADVGFLVGGVDISNRYETIGGATPIAATGFKAGGTDLASLFKGISAVTNLSLGAISQNFPGNTHKVGFSTDGASFGTLTPGTLGGQSINNMVDFTSDFSPADNSFIFSIAAAGLPQNFFTQIQINGHTYPSSAASFSNSGSSFWQWFVNLGYPLAGMLNGGTYPVVIT